ncbi:MAG: dipeptide epimerase [Alphaproteobacteria bacterium]|nr:dipeptide epimerase [Alphaproteobacteria bacterium]
MRLEVEAERWPLRKPFRISRGTKADCELVSVRLADAAHAGRGEGAPVTYHGETAASLAEAVEALRPRLEAGLTRAELQALMPRGGARNAVDCALWDLEAKRAGRSIWELLALSPRPVETAYTIGLDTREAMIADAEAAAGRRLLKLKLDAADPLGALEALHAARPDARFILDANGALAVDEVARLAGDFARLGAVLLEQPCAVGADEGLEGIASPVPLCADESCQDRSDLPGLVRRYRYVNVKLDKAGGLTEALALASAARAEGLRLMVGCMLGTSLAMAPAFVVAQGAEFVDLDGPLLLARDRAPAIAYAAGRMDVFAPALWG